MKRHTILKFAFFGMLAITLFFAFRLTVSTIVWSNPDRMDQAIAGWMTPRYVVKSWQLPPDVVITALDLKFESMGPLITLTEIAELQGRDVGDLIHDMEVAIVAFRAGSND
jgi:hypothetical protein